MDSYSYTFLILLLPALSFLVLGLCGMKMSHKLAGLIGTTVLGVVTVLSYYVAFTYFSAPRLADGTYPTIVPFNFTWLPLSRNQWIIINTTTTTTIEEATFCKWWEQEKRSVKNKGFA